MSGHSKWSTIKRQKQSEDKKRGQQFTKLGRAITLAVREGGGIDDPATNFKLRLAIDRAKQNNMPKENIKRAIDRGAGKGSEGDNFESILYEGYAAGGIALLIETVTDNKQRTGSQVKFALEKSGGSLGAPGSVSFQFDQKGRILVKKGNISEEELFEKAIESGAADIKDAGDFFEVYTDREALNDVQETLTSSGIDIEDAALVYRPTTAMQVENVQTENKIRGLISELEEMDDVQNVYSNVMIYSS